MRSIPVVLILFAATPAAAAECPGTLGRADCPAVMNQFIVKVTDAARNRLFLGIDPLVLRMLDSPDTFVVRVRPEDRERFLDRAEKEAEYVSPDFKRFPAQGPDDPYYERSDYQCGLSRIKSEPAWATLGGAKLGAGASTIVAFIDSGVESSHPDLRENLWLNDDETPGDGKDDDGNQVKDDVHGASWRNGVPSPHIEDEIGHGTHVTGIAAAFTNNTLGIAGTAWRARIMTLKFIHRYADGIYGLDSDAIQALRYAAREGASVINLSWGSYCYSKAVCETISDLQRDGKILIIAAAGNGRRNNDDPSNAYYPASFTHDDIISVMATTCADTVARFSNYGSASVDIAAPGAGIWSTFPHALQKHGYQFASGTSAAAPFVTGAALLLALQNPAWDAGQVKARIIKTAHELDPALKGRCVSNGRLDLDKALSP